MAASNHTNNGIPVGIGYDSKDRAKSLMELSSISVTTVSATNYIGVPAVGGVTEVSGMTDVCIGETPTGGQAMVWSATPGCWVASTIPTGTAGGGGPYVLVSTNTQLSANVTSNTNTISTNSTNIGLNTTGIEFNSTNIGLNTTGIEFNSTNIGLNTTGIEFNSNSIGELQASSWEYSGASNYVSSYITANETAWNAGGGGVTELQASSWEYSGASMYVSSYITANETAWNAGGADVVELQASSWEYSGASNYVSANVTELQASSWEYSGASNYVSSYITANETAWNAGGDVAELQASSWEYSGASNFVSANVAVLEASTINLNTSTINLSSVLQQNVLAAVQNGTDIFWLQTSAYGLSSVASGLVVSAGNMSSLVFDLETSTVGVSSEFASHAASSPAHSIYLEKSITIESPVAGDNITLMHSVQGYTLNSISTVMSALEDGSPTSAAWTFYTGTDRKAGTLLYSSGTGSTTGESFDVAGSPSIDANKYVWLFVDSIDGTFTDLHISLHLGYT